MKRAALLLLLIFSISTAFAIATDPIIMKIGKKDITKSEFEYIWSKNNTNNTIEKKSIDDYVDLFVNFKLKVAEAEAQGIDTTKSFLDELEGYRSQLVAPYLIDKEAEEALALRTYDRIKEYVEVSHILIKVSKDASPEDTLAAWGKVTKVYNDAIKGVDFAKLAKEYSDDGSKDDGGYLGFTTGFRYVYPFENAAYNTPVGKISQPFRTQFGYHIVKVHSRRAAGGRYRSGHIFKMASIDAPKEDQLAAKEAIFKIYNEIKQGGDFQKFAENESDDKGAASNHGEYGMLYCGTLPIEYEDAVYSLKPGEYSAPFHSKYGWHIVKALEFLPYPSMEEMREDINSIIGRDERNMVAKTSLIEKLKKEYSYSPVLKNYNVFVSAWDNLRNNQDSTGIKALQKSDFPIFMLDGISYPQSLFAKFITDNGSGNNLKVAYTNFVNDRILAYENSRLEKKYPDFGHLMQEYRDGILLFEICNREVWEKATKDTVGLESYFKAHKADYAWEKPRYKGFIISCADKDVAFKAKKLMHKLASDSVAVVLNRIFNTDSTTLVKVERGLYAVGENPVSDSLVFKQKNTKKDEKLPVQFLKGYMLEIGPESYTDVRGLVISDYQNLLEKDWIDRLKKKFEVNIYKEVVNTVNKD